MFALAYATGFLATLDFLPAYGIELVPIGPAFALATFSIVGLSMRRYHLFDITPAFAAEHIVATISDALIVADGEGSIRIVNDAARRLSGYAQSQLQGMELARLLTFNDGSGQLQPREGAPIPVSVAVSPLMDEERRAGTVIIAHDLRELLRIEDALRQQEVRLRTEELRRKAQLEYRTLIESLPDAVIHFDANGIVRYINERATVLIDAAEVIRRNLLPLDRRPHRSEIALPAADGHTRWMDVAVSAVIDETGTFLGSICILTDVTERRLAQQMIAASARDWHETFDALQSPLAVVDANGIVQRANAAAELAGEELTREIGHRARTATTSERGQFESV